MCRPNLESYQVNYEKNVSGCCDLKSVYDKSSKIVLRKMCTVYYKWGQLNLNLVYSLYSSDVTHKSIIIFAKKYEQTVKIY